MAHRYSIHRREQRKKDKNAKPPKDICVVSKHIVWNFLFTLFGFAISKMI